MADAGTGDQIQANQEAFATCTGILEESFEDIGNTHTRFNSEGSALAGNWTGRAGAAYQELFYQLDDRITQSKEQLKGISDALLATDGAFEQADAHQASTIEGS
jgi:WXG100 family type VII secretion target